MYVYCSVSPLSACSVSQSLFSYTLSQGDTLQNVASELDCILSSGRFVFNMIHDDLGQGAEILLQYSPSTLTQTAFPHSPGQPASLQDSEELAASTEKVCSQVVSRLESQNDGASEAARTRGSNVEMWNAEQISDFVRKLGFLDTEKEGGDKIKDFLHINEVI